MLISIKEWAEKVGIAAVSARQKAQRGKIPAKKIGRDWFIEEDTPNLDNRKKGIGDRWK